MKPRTASKRKAPAAPRKPEKEPEPAKGARRVASGKGNRGSRGAPEGSEAAPAGSGAAPAGSEAAPGGSPTEGGAPLAGGERSALEVWRAEAMRLPAGGSRPRVPLHVLLDEAVAVARFFEKYFATVRNEDGSVGRIGLDSVARPGREVTAAAGAEVLSLREAIHEAQALYVAASKPREKRPVERGRVVLREIRSALAFLFDDGKRDVKDVQLERFEASGRGSRSESVLLMRLHEFGTFANVHRAELDGLGGFDVRLIDEALALSAALRALSPRVPAHELPGARMDLRNRLAALLAGRVASIRSAARFVFRGSPDIVREATSVYERRRAVAARRAKAEKGAGGGAPTGTEGAPAPKRASRSRRKPK